MPTDVGSDDNPLLRHGLERFERSHQLGQARRDSRKDEEIHQIVVTLYLLVRHASGKDDALAEIELLRNRLQVAFFWAAADKQDGDIRTLPPQIWNGVQKQIQPFVRVERPEEAEDDFPAESEPSLERPVRNARPFERIAIDGVGMTVILSPATPRPIASARSPSQIVVTASA